ncbi:germinal center-associated signaling and motility protein isoform X6 [Macaca fascicularis]|uniref:germinal center-associated signaling and motility protein isoform X6 n=1 Tax=Macaca fascicularis TaxID=9541 RepID=UPI003D15E3B0
MGNSLLRENRWQQNSQEMPWNLRMQSPKQRTSRCWDHRIAEGCFCFPWKKILIFEKRQDSQNESSCAEDKLQQGVGRADTRRPLRRLVQ